MDSHRRMGDGVQTLFHLLIMAHIIALFKSMGHVLISSVSTRYRLENQTSVHVSGTVSAQWLWISMDSHVCVHIYDMYFIYIIHRFVYLAWLTIHSLFPSKNYTCVPPIRVATWSTCSTLRVSLQLRWWKGYSFERQLMCFKLCAPQHEAIVLRQG